MEINKATKLAIEKNMYMTRKVGGVWDYLRIKPTNTELCCVVHVTKKYEEMLGEKIDPGKRWNPTAEDLIANDWYVLEK